MQDAIVSERSWRVDPIDAQSSSNDIDSASGHRSRSELQMIASTPGTGTAKSTVVDYIRRCDRLARAWVRARFSSSGAAELRFAETLHQFAAIIGTADNPAIVEAALLRMVRDVAAATRIELTIGSGPPIKDGDDLADGSPAATKTTWRTAAMRFSSLPCGVVRRDRPASCSTPGTGIIRR